MLSGMTKPSAAAAALEHRRAEAIEQIADADRQLDELRSQREHLHDDDEHDPDGVSLSSEWSRLEGLRQSRLEALAKIDEARSRLADGDYGVCSSCGEPIAPERLEIRPDATTCVSCAT